MDDKLKTDRQAIRQALARDTLLKSADYSLRYDRVILFGGQVPDTLLATHQEPLWLAGKNHGKDSAFWLVGQSQQRSGFPVKAVIGNAAFYQLVVSTSAFVYSPDRQRPVYLRMALTLAGSAVLILSVLTLFIAAFGAILRQKRIADITTDFANNMTHELKTPLSAAGLAVKSLRTPEAAKDTRWSADLLDQLEKQLERIRRLMESVLDSALAHPIQQPRLQGVRLVPIFDELRNLAAESGRSLLIDMVKPFDADELVLRVKNILKRSTVAAPQPSSYAIGRYRFEPAELHLLLEDQRIPLTPKEAALLEMLCLQPGRLVKRKDILETIWGSADFFNGRSLDVFIRRLRKLLAGDPAVAVEVVRSAGFVLHI